MLSLQTGLDVGEATPATPTGPHISLGAQLADPFFPAINRNCICQHSLRTLLFPGTHELLLCPFPSKNEPLQHNNQQKERQSQATEDTKHKNKETNKPNTNSPNANKSQMGFRARNGLSHVCVYCCCICPLYWLLYVLFCSTGFSLFQLFLFVGERASLCSCLHFFFLRARVSVFVFVFVFCTHESLYLFSSLWV